MAWMMSPGSGEQLPALEEVLRRPVWMELAARAGMPLETFFPAHGQTAAPGRAVCATCSVRPECLDYARTDSDMAGVWGGTTQRETAAPRSGGVTFHSIPCPDLALVVALVLGFQCLPITSAAPKGTCVNVRFPTVSVRAFLPT